MNHESRGGGVPTAGSVPRRGRTALGEVVAELLTAAVAA